MSAGIPVFDLGPAFEGSSADRTALAKQIGAACEGVGFFAVANHRVQWPLIGDAFAVSAEFFDLPTTAKLRYAPADPTVPRGYNAFKSRNLGRTLGLDTPPDLREQYFIGPLVADPGRFATYPGADRFYSTNIWPDAVPAYRTVFGALYGEMEALAKEMMRLFALALDLDECFFDDKIDRHFSTLPSNNYPDLPEEVAPEQRRAGAHTDFGSLTLLAVDDASGGLQVDVPGIGWTDVRPPPESLIVNLGDMMARWTGDRWRSTLHRVANPPASRGSDRRQSLAFFLHPNYDAEVACLPTCFGPGRAPAYPPIMAGEHMRRKLERRVA
jgi:isopenicillin N synthase-like dioxygenase